MRHEEREPSGWRVSNGRPEPAQLAAVMQPIVETVDPEMVIVFGSAARATMTAESDVDLVVVKDVSDLEAMKARAAVCLPTGHPPVHIVPATRRLLNDLRDSPSWVYGPAMAEGIVAYERGGGTREWSTRAWDRIAIPESPGERMVRILYYQREEAMDWLRKAEHDMQVVRSRDTTIGLQVRCYSAQAAAEKAIKALLVAHGQPVRAEHELHKLAEELEKTGEKLPATATRERLELLAKFGGEAQYPRWQDPTTDADKTHFCQIATQVYDRARARAPEVLDARAREEVGQVPAQPVIEPPTTGSGNKDGTQS